MFNEKRIILTNLTSEDFHSIISECITREFDKHHTYEKPPEDDLLNIDQVVTLLKVCKATIFVWKKQGLLPFHRLGRRIFFKKSEVLESLKKIEKQRLGF